LHPSMYIWGVQNTEKYGRNTQHPEMEKTEEARGPQWMLRPLLKSKL
jgi:hypothetical protein